VVKVLLVKCPADALRHSSLQLPLDITGMKCAPRILRNRATQNLHLARIGIDLNIDTHRGEGNANCPSAIECCPPGDGAAGACKSGRELLKCHWRGDAGRAETSPLEIDHRRRLQPPLAAKTRSDAAPTIRTN